MFIYFQVLSCILSISIIQCRPQDFKYQALSSPNQNSFAFQTPNLRQFVTTSVGGQQQAQLQQAQLQQAQLQQAQLQQQQLQQQQLQQQQLQQQQLYQPQLQQQYNPQALQQYQQQLYQQQVQQYQQALNNQYQYQQLTPEQMMHQQILAAYMQQVMHDSLASDPNAQQFQAPFRPSAPATEQTEQLKQESLLGVRFSPSNQVSNVKFQSGPLKYDF